MRKHVVSVGFIALALSTQPAPAQSAPAQSASAPIPGVPVCGLCFINPPTPLGRSPKNAGVAPAFQYTFSITLIDGFGVPVPGFPAAAVALNIAAPCTNPVVIPPAGPSDAAGVMAWPAASLDIPGGTCFAPVFVSIAVVPPCVIPIPYVTSPDEDGNGIINLADLSVFAAAFLAGGPLRSGDINRSLAVGLPDLAFFQQHFAAP